jgi:hypothetical protein
MTHHLVIAAIFKNENPYLEEWLEYHHLVGFDHFYLYDDDGGEPARALLAPYVEAGLVTHHDWTHLRGSRHDKPTRFGGRDKNHMAFGHAAKHYRGNFDWIMKIDLDEFLEPLDGDRVDEIVDRFDADRTKCIRIPRINFGDNGHHERPDDLVLASYLRREAIWSDHKDLGNGRFLSSNDRTNSAHSWGLRWFTGARTINEKTVSALRVNHYYTKSLDEYLNRQNTMQSRPISEEGFRQKNEGRNDVLDESMMRFVPALRERIATRRSARDAAS